MINGKHLAAGSASYTTDPIVFTGNDIDECVTVSDSYAGTLGTVCVGEANPATFTYLRTIAIPASGCEDYPNTAAFTTNDTGGTGSASQSVKVCAVPVQSLVVTKTVVTSFKRTYHWTIDKVGSVTALTLAPKKSALVNYSVTVAATYTDSKFVVSGKIFIYNPNSDLTATIGSVVDDVGGVPATVTCPAKEVAPGATLVCTYTTGLLAAKPSGDTNTVTVTTSGAVGGGTATEPVVFGAPAMEWDKCVTVKASKKGTLGTVCYPNVPKTFTYSLTVGPYCNSGTYNFVNIASFKTNNTYTTGSDSWTVKVTVKTTCVYNPYYWWWPKTCKR